MRESEFLIRVGLWAPYLIRGANIRVGLGEPLQYCLVSGSLVGTGAGVEPVSWTDPEFPVLVSRFFLTEGGSEMERFACATGANAEDGVSGVRKTEWDKIGTRRLCCTVLARFRWLSLALAFAGQEWDRSGGDSEKSTSCTPNRAPNNTIL